MKYDIASKRLADLGIESLVSRFLQIEIEDSKLIEELPQETVTIRSSDFPIRIREKNGNESIVLLEFQTQWESDLPLRIGEYVLLRPKWCQSADQEDNQHPGKTGSRVACAR